MGFAKCICKKSKFPLFDGQNQPALFVSDTLIYCLNGIADTLCNP